MKKIGTPLEKETSGAVLYSTVPNKHPGHLSLMKFFFHSKTVIGPLLLSKKYFSKLELLLRSYPFILSTGFIPFLLKKDPINSLGNYEFYYYLIYLPIILII